MSLADPDPTKIEHVLMAAPDGRIYETFRSIDDYERFEDGSVAVWETMIKVYEEMGIEWFSKSTEEQDRVRREVHSRFGVDLWREWRRFLAEAERNSSGGSGRSAKRWIAKDAAEPHSEQWFSAPEG